jgi:hypothetical protein
LSIPSLPCAKEQSETGHWWHTPVILVTWKVEIRRIKVQSHPRQTVHKTPISKITRAKWTRGVAQALEYLICKHETLSSNPNPTKRKKKKIIGLLRKYFRYFMDCNLTQEEVLCLLFPHIDSGFLTNTLVL